MAKKYNFLLAAQDYFQIRDEFEEFSKLKKHAFAVFNSGFDVNQLGPRLESWRALCEWNRNDVKRSYGMADINFHVVTLIFEDLAHRRIKRKKFYDDLASVREMLNNYEVTLSTAKYTKYKEFISLYNARAKVTQNLLGSIVKELQVVEWFMDLLQS